MLRNRLRQQVQDNTAATTNVTPGYLLDEWLAGHQVEETTRASYRLLMAACVRRAVQATRVQAACTVFGPPVSRSAQWCAERRQAIIN